MRPFGFGLALAFIATMSVAVSACDVPAEILAWQGGVGRIAAKLKARTAVKIVALGADFSQGAFPEALRAELVRLYPGVPIEVHQSAGTGIRPVDMLMSLDRKIVALGPDLVIWEPGTYNVDGAGASGALRTVVRDGVMRLRFVGIGVILIEPTRSFDFGNNPNHANYLETLRDLALERDVPIYRRFDVSRVLGWQREAEPYCAAQHVAQMIFRSYR